MSTIGSRIRQKRQELGMSVDELAARLGKNRATVYRYESDDIENFPISIIGPLAEALQVSPAYLMGWTKRDFIRTPGGSVAFYAVHKRGIQRDIHKILFPSDIKFELEVVVVEVHGHQECVEQFGLAALVLDIAVPI